MDSIVVRGGCRLSGEVEVEGAKNAALPILFAALLTDEPCVFRNVPEVVDVRTALRLLADLGADVQQEGTTVWVRAKHLRSIEAPYELVKTMRASFLVLGPLLARCGHARVSTPGGCAIGARPVDLHIKGLEQLGARVEVVHGYAEARCSGRLRGATVYLDVPSVGATEHLLMVACLAEGTTRIEQAAREPEVVDLAEVLCKMGARIRGAGEDILVVDGVERLHGVEHTIIPDRIEAGTFLIGAAMTQGDVFVRNARPEHLHALLLKLREAGADVTEDTGGVRVRGRQRLRSVDVKTMPYPGFPTDLQAQFMAAMTCAEGRAVITETIFENRFLHAVELNRLGADIKISGNAAVVQGVEKLSGAPVMATDLRASVSLVLAGLVAEGETEVSRVYHLDRGYFRLEQKLRALGADVERRGRQKG
ncbi:MAG: UDP-N-acetylglucosamine 1-carboxyvinyltransferase [Candidatus Binatia bacterium]|nr:MAG: UDP-N-acetylglucosamine 1-carboxyvinyltransferase [Candidatus Binatia bacterium]